MGVWARKTKKATREWSRASVQRCTITRDSGSYDPEQASEFRNKAAYLQVIYALNSQVVRTLYKPCFLISSQTDTTR